MKQYGPMSLEDSQENAKLLKKKNYNPTFINCRDVLLNSCSIDFVTCIIKNYRMMNLVEYFSLQTCRKPLMKLCAFETLMQLWFPPHCTFFLIYSIGMDSH